MLWFCIYLDKHIFEDSKKMKKKFLPKKCGNLFFLESEMQEKKMFGSYFVEMFFAYVSDDSKKKKVVLKKIKKKVQNCFSVAKTILNFVLKFFSQVYS